MLIGLRNAMMAGKRLPYDAEVEYLGCTGGIGIGQYIDTGIAPTDNAQFELTVEQDTTVSLANVGLVCAWKTVGDASTAGTYIVSRIYSSTGRGTYIQWGQSSTVGVNIPYPTGRVTFGISKSGMTYNGDAAYSIRATAVSQLGNAYILGSPVSGMRRLYGKFYGYKHFEGSALVRDLIPVRMKGVGYAYDRVSGALLGNQGTGAFIIGPDASAANGGGV